MEIKLTAEQEAYAFKIAKKRDLVHKLAGTNDDSILKTKYTGKVGAAGELAASLLLGLPWNKIQSHKKWMKQKNTINGRDLGKIAEVRTTLYAKGRLPIKPRDPEETPWILVLANRAPIYKIAGWCYGHEGKHYQYLDNPRGKYSYFVPQNKLRDTESLKKLIEKLTKQGKHKNPSQ